ERSAGAAAGEYDRVWQESAARLPPTRRPGLSAGALPRLNAAGGPQGGGGISDGAKTERPAARITAENVDPRGTLRLAGLHGLRGTGSGVFRKKSALTPR